MAVRQAAMAASAMELAAALSGRSPLRPHACYPSHSTFVTSGSSSRGIVRSAAGNACIASCRCRSNRLRFPPLVQSSRSCLKYKGEGNDLNSKGKNFNAAAIAASDATTRLIIQRPKHATATSCRRTLSKEVDRTRGDPQLLSPCRASSSASSPSRSQDFPYDYDQLLLQAKDATTAALLDGCKLLEIEFPTASLDSVPGDAEGGVEMTLSMQMVREFARMFTVSGRTKGNARIFFPDANEVDKAMQDVFASKSSSSPQFRLDFLTKPSGLEDLGLSRKVDLRQSTAADDDYFVAAYPHFNVNEMLAVEQLYTSVAKDGGQPIIVFNGELDRIRSGYYPSFFYPKLAKLAKDFLPLFDTVFYIHNFKGRRGGRLFRVYPGPWQVLREDSNGQMRCIHTQDKMPSLKEVALEILPSR